MEGCFSGITDPHRYQYLRTDLTEVLIAVSLFSHRTGLGLAVSFYQNAKKGEAEVAGQALSGLSALGGVVCADALHTKKKRREQY